MSAKRKAKDEPQAQPTYEEQFQARAKRVYEEMRRQRIDFRGVPFVTPDGRIAVRVVPVEMDQP